MKSALAEVYKPRTAPKKQAKVKKVMGEFKRGKLHSGSKSGPVVKNRKQGIAIALSEAGLSRKSKLHDAYIGSVRG